jgi:hypothetical protein
LVQIELTRFWAWHRDCTLENSTEVAMRDAMGNKTNVIQVQVKTVYGVDKIYPICEDAKTFASIAGTKTLSCRDVENIKNLGFRVELVQQPTTL